MNTKRLINEFLLVIEKKQIPFYCDRQGRPFLELPFDPKKRPWPLRSQSVRSWICTECFQELNTVPSSGEIEAVLNILEGYAQRNIRSGIADADLAPLVEQDSLLQAVLEFMNDKKQYVTIMSKLMADLKTLAEKNGLLHSGKRKWPGASWVFSQRLTEAKSILHRLGILLTSRHTKQGAEVTLENLGQNQEGDASSVTESPSASSPNPQSIEDLQPGDALSDHADATWTAEDLAAIAALNRKKAARALPQSVPDNTSSQGKEDKS